MKIALDDIDAIKLLVDKFYAKVRRDTLLKDIFDNAIQDNWPAHLAKLYTFWQTILLDDRSYYGNPFIPHAPLPVEKTHFEQWLFLFYETLEDNFIGEKADEAKWRAGKMAEMFHYRIMHYRENNSEPLH